MKLLAANGIRFHGRGHWIQTHYVALNGWQWGVSVGMN